MGNYGTAFRQTDAAHRQYPEAQASHREAKRIQCREDILRAAEKLFKAHGFNEVRMIDVAHAAKISEKTLFNYFASKPALLEALALLWFETMNDLFPEPETLSGASIEQALPPALDRRLLALEDYRWLLAMAAEHTQLFTTPNKSLVLLQHNFDARTKRIQQLQTKGVIRTDIPAEEISDLYQALRNHLLGSWLRADTDGFKILQKKFQRSMAVFIRGLLPDKSGK